MSLINIQNLTFSYDGTYDNIFENVSFQLDTDWKLGFTGRNGRGKTTFLNLLLGRYSYSGKISASVNFEYFPFKVQDKTINTIDVVEQIYPDYEYWQVAKELNLLCVDEDILYRPFETLSNGEQAKVLLAVMFLKENSFSVRVIPFQILACVIFLLEIGKQIVSLIRGYDLYHLPFHFCSLFIFMLPIAAFYRGRKKERVFAVTAAITAVL